MTKNKTLISIFAVFIISALSLFSFPKLSPNAKLLLHQINKSNSWKTNILLKQEYCGALIKVSDFNIEDELVSLNIKVNTKAKDIWSIRIPIDKIEALSKIEGIEYIQLDEPVIYSLDQARKLTRVDSVQSGFGLDQPGYSGKNVIVGVVDNGFDYTNPVFYDTLTKKYKIIRLWDQKISGIPPQGFSYGNEFTTANEILDLKTDVANMSHGTHVASIAAGNGTGSGGLFKGMAPDAELVIVSRVPSIVDDAISTGFTSLIDGINYVFKYADTRKLPAVVNLSLGNLTGPHDGTSLISQACNNMSGKGRIITFAAGNSNGTNAHFNYQFTPTDTIFNTFVDLVKSQGEEIIWVDCWGEKDKNFAISLALFDSLNNKMITQTSFYSTTKDTIIQLSLKGSDDSTCTIDLVVTAKEFNNKPRIFINIDRKTKDKLLISGRGKEGTVHLWNSYINGYTGYNVAFSSYKFAWAKDGNNQITIGDFPASDSVITAGAYISKTSWYNLDGAQLGYWSLKVGNIAPFSSLGPTVDGRMKPDIAAPGMALISAINSYDTTYFKGGDYYDYSSKSYVSGGRTYLFAAMSGTSMASPCVTGIIALMLEKKPDLTPYDIKFVLKRTAIKDAAVNDTNVWGYGKINAYQCRRYLENKVDVAETSISNNSDFSILPNPNNGIFSLIFAEPVKSTAKVIIYDILGNKVYNTDINENQNHYDFNLHELSKGTYFIKVYNGEKINFKMFVIY